MRREEARGKREEEFKSDPHTHTQLRTAKSAACDDELDGGGGQHGVRGAGEGSEGRGVYIAEQLGVGVDRAAEVARRREEAEREKKLALQRKLEEKDRKRGVLPVLSGTAASATTGCPSAGPGAGDVTPLSGLEAEQARLVKEMEQIAMDMRVPEVSSAKAFALKKKLAVCRAELLKLEAPILKRTL